MASLGHNGLTLANKILQKVQHLESWSAFGNYGAVWYKQFWKVYELYLVQDSAHGSVQDSSNSSALAMKLLQSCTEPLIWAVVFIMIYLQL